ncbi:GrpB family protein [Rubrivirga litoralis]|uniref:GrpB family protein n=1 Tax=Rubrivirga litoralis TaxID=3075598 RepID=A0ABU3BSM7_9BACT|nr:GrpB family protein [Rubrivirga sp. F394]MDT0632294.1 GrpB family protein [Rubrivirga sp. F394]
MSLVIANYDPEWPLHFEREASAVRSVQGVHAVEHVGSTAVPGLAARPTIDLLVGVDDSAAAPPAPFEALGYHEEAGAPLRTFWKGTRAFKTYELLVVEAGGAVWRRRLDLRDRLRADPALAEHYAHRKRELALAHEGNPAAYAEAKAGFVDALLS